MSSSSSAQCDPCSFNHISKQATVWCLSCEEGLCQTCADIHKGIKATRNHKVVPIENSKTISALTDLTSLQCKEHQKVIDLYCPKHDESFCSLCLSTKHRHCENIGPLDDVAKNVISSESFTRIEEEIENLLTNIDKVKTNREANIENLTSQKTSLCSTFTDIRKDLNAHLDTLEQALYQELSGCFGNCETMIRTSLRGLENRKTNLFQIKKIISDLKPVASDAQIFVAIRKIQKKIETEKDLLNEKDLVPAMQELNLSLNVDPIKAMMKYTTLGSITVAYNPSTETISELITKSAQMSVRPDIAEIDGINLKARIFIQNNADTSYGCGVLNNGDMLFTNDRANKLEIFCSNGRHKMDISVPNTPCNIALLSEDCIAVTYGNGYRFEIADITDFKYKVVKSIITDTTCWGISQADDKLAVKLTTKGVYLFDLQGRLFKKLHMLDSECTYHIAMFGHKIYFSKTILNSIHCCDLDGNEIWQFKNGDLKSPKGITTDKYGNVFVVGTESKNLYVISANGKKWKKLVTFDKCPPCSVYFDKINNCILVRNVPSGAVLYDVKYM